MTFTICKMWICLLNAVCFLVLKNITQKEENLRTTNRSVKGWAGGEILLTLWFTWEKKNPTGEYKVMEDMKLR